MNCKFRPASPDLEGKTTTQRAPGVVRLAVFGWHGSLLGMMISPNPYRGFRFPAEIIEHAVWLYHVFILSLRDVELILAERGMMVSFESLGEWGPRSRNTSQERLDLFSGTPLGESSV